MVELVGHEVVVVCLDRPLKWAGKAIGHPSLPNSLKRRVDKHCDSLDRPLSARSEVVRRTTFEEAAHLNS
eukprot:12920255-Heterocapsa_arctica.AAC.1